MKLLKKTSLALLCSQMSLMAMILSSTGLALPRLKEEIGLNPIQQGSLVSLQYIGFTIAVLVGGTLLDKFGRYKVLSLSFGILGLSAFLFGASTQFWMSVIGVLMIGAFGSITQNGITTLATNFDRNNSEKNNAFVQLFFTVGAVLTPLLILAFMMLLDSWRLAYYTVGILCIAIALITSRYKEEKSQTGISLRDNMSVYIKALKTPSYLIAPVALLLYVGTEIGVWGFAPVLFENQGYGALSGILASILIWLSMLIGRILSVRLLKKVDMIPILVGYGLLAAIALVCVIFTGQIASIIWISISGFACAPFYPLLVTWMTRITGERSSSALALTMAFGSLGAVFMGWLAGLVVDIMGAKYVTAVPAISMVILILLLVFFRNRKAEQQ